MILILLLISFNVFAQDLIISFDYKKYKESMNIYIEEIQNPKLMCETACRISHFDTLKMFTENKGEDKVKQSFIDNEFKKIDELNKKCLKNCKGYKGE